MKMMRNTVVSLFMVLLSAPLIFGQQLSKYRAFSLGMTLSELSKQVGPYSHWTTLIHQRPAVIQELTFWSLSASRAPVGGFHRFCSASTMASSTEWWRLTIGTPQKA
jgi:hypothetical protein